MYGTIIAASSVVLAAAVFGSWAFLKLWEAKWIKNCVPRSAQARQPLRAAQITVR